MSLELKTKSDGVDVGGLIFDEQYTFEWVDRSDPAEEPKYDKPNETQVRFRCKMRIISQPEDLGDAEGNAVSLIGREILDFYTVSLHRKANFGQIVRAMMGMKPDEEFADQRFDVDTLCASKSPDGVGGKFRGTLRQKENGYPKITTPLPVRGARNRNPAAAPSNEPPF